MSWKGVRNKPIIYLRTLEVEPITVSETDDVTWSGRSNFLDVTYKLHMFSLRFRSNVTSLHADAISRSKALYNGYTSAAAWMYRRGLSLLIGIETRKLCAFSTSVSSVGFGLRKHVVWWR